MMYESLLFIFLLVIIFYVGILILKEKKILFQMNRYIRNKNEMYYEKILQQYDKSKKIKLKEKWNYFHKITILINRCELSNTIIFNPFSIVAIGVLCVIASYYIAFSFLGIILLSFVISVPLFFLPFMVLYFIAEWKEQKIEKVFLNFLLQLKNHTQIHNDIVMAMKEVKTIEPLNGYVKKFLIEVTSGIKFEKAIENWKEKINVEQMKMFLTNVQHCYLYGGDFSELIQKSYEIIGEIQKEKLRRKEETKSARIVLAILILLDILVYGAYIKSNMENFKIMKNTLLGNAILYWNFISIWLLVVLAIRVKKLDY